MKSGQQFETHSAEETRALGRRFSTDFLPPGEWCC